MLRDRHYVYRGKCYEIVLGYLSVLIKLTPRWKERRGFPVIKAEGPMRKAWGFAAGYKNTVRRRATDQRER
jgi:hypothetical protein